MQLNVDTVPYWIDSAKLPKFAKLDRDEAVDVAIVDAEFMDEVPFVGAPGVRFNDQARFHPRKYLAGVA